MGCVLGLAGVPTASATDPPAKLGKDFHILGSRQFTIPYQPPSTAGGAQLASGRVELLVAAGDALANHAGTPTWSTAATGPVSSQRAFSFHAPRDGEYWFTTRTRIPGKPEASLDRGVLKVFVDTTAPKIDLVADAAADGTIRADIRIADATTVDESQIVVRYITSTMKDQDPAIVKFVPGGSLQFKAPGDWTQIAVDVVATDPAGNMGRQTKVIRRPRIASRHMERFAANPDRFQIRLPDPATPEQISNFGKTDGASRLIDATDEPETVPPPVGEKDPAAWPNSAASNPPVPNSNVPNSVAPAQRPRTAAEAIRPLDQPGAVPPEAVLEQRRAQRAQRAQQTQQVQRANIDGSSTDVASETAASTPVQPKDIRDAGFTGAGDRYPLRHSRSNQFSLDYELQAVGGRGVEAVELYGTTDGGQSWRLWGRDPDVASPFDIEVREEGVFGFRVVVIGRDGLASPRPMAGDDPDMAVLVDQTRPTIQITGAKYGDGDDIGALIIRYRCEDANLEERPITLAYGPSLDGPWTTIAGGLANDGRYAWPADPGIPRKFYIRIDVTDRAGNTTTDILQQAIDAGGLAPRATIRGFRLKP